MHIRNSEKSTQDASASFVLDESEDINDEAATVHVYLVMRTHLTSFQMKYQLFLLMEEAML